MKFSQHDTPDDTGVDQKLDNSVSATTSFQMVSKITAVQTNKHSLIHNKQGNRTLHLHILNYIGDQREKRRCVLRIASIRIVGSLQFILHLQYTEEGVRTRQPHQ